MALSAFDRPFVVGSLTLPNRAFLAPMSGVTDLPFRLMAARYGAGLVVSEMVACRLAASGSEEARLRAEGHGLDIHVVQLAARDPADFVAGVRIAEAAGADLIDINMGCPAKRVTGGYAGSALMREPDLAARIMDAVVSTASVPVSLKMRLGWDEDSLNAPDIARQAEQAGISLVTVHGRTRCQFYQGAANWSAIRAVKDAVTIPVIANGDLSGPDAAPAMLAASGADAVMIGRAAYGQPWIVGHTGAALEGQPLRPGPTGGALVDHILEHHEMMLSQYGLAQGLRIARKHLGWYLDRCAAFPAGLRQAILTSTDRRAIAGMIRAGIGDCGEAIAA